MPQMGMGMEHTCVPVDWITCRLNKMNFNNPFAAVAAVSLLIGSGTAFSADLSDPAALPQEIDARVDRGWQFEVGVYGFLPDMNATTTSGDKLDLPLWEILQNLNFTAMAEAKVRKDRFYAFTDLLYMNLQGTDTTTVNILGSSVEAGAGVQLEAVINTTGVGYTVVDTPGTQIAALGGFRYLWLNTDISANLGGLHAEVLDQEHLFDGIVGVSGQTEITDKLYVTYYGDVGAGQSDLTWQLFGSLNYRLKHVDAVLGYRYMDWRFDDVANLKELSAHGPLVGIRYKF